MKTKQNPSRKSGDVMLERMDIFFENRLSAYDEHMPTAIEGANEFYKYTASLLPQEANAEVLDLGCGTGLELAEYFALNPNAHITGIDLSKAMLEALAAKFPDRKLNLICNSYFEEDLGFEKYNAAVSVESLHHFTSERKLSLYRKLLRALKTNGYFILTDYFAESEALEIEYFETLEKLKREQGISDDEFYHYDTPLTAGHEIEILKKAGFSDVKILKKLGCYLHALGDSVSSDSPSEYPPHSLYIAAQSLELSLEKTCWPEEAF